MSMATQKTYKSRTGGVKRIVSKPSSQRLGGLLGRMPVPIKTSKKLILFFMATFALVGVLVVYRSFAATPQGTYSNWFWSPPTSGFSNVRHTLTIEKVSENATYFWSHQYKFVGGDGGYIGLQSGGSRVDGTKGKTAVFSVFNAGIAGTSGGCTVQQAGFDGGTGSGTSCRIAYDWIVGRTYTLKVQKGTIDSKGIWWVGTVVDMTTNIATEIGRYEVPLTWKGLGDWSVMWTEYFGVRPPTCEALPYSRVRFSQPTAEDGAIVPTSSNSYLTETADCKNSKVTSVGTDVIQEMGNDVVTVPPITRNNPESTVPTSSTASNNQTTSLQAASTPKVQPAIGPNTTGIAVQSSSGDPATGSAAGSLTASKSNGVTSTKTTRVNSPSRSPYWGVGIVSVILCLIVGLCTLAWYYLLRADK